MSTKGVGALRMKKELKMLYEEPPPGISAWSQEENCHELQAGVCIHLLVCTQSC